MGCTQILGLISQDVIGYSGEIKQENQAVHCLKGLTWDSESVDKQLKPQFAGLFMYFNQS